MKNRKIPFSDSPVAINLLDALRWAESIGSDGMASGDGRLIGESNSWGAIPSIVGTRIGRSRPPAGAGR